MNEQALRRLALSGAQQFRMIDVIATIADGVVEENCSDNEPEGCKEEVDASVNVYS